MTGLLGLVIASLGPTVAMSILLWRTRARDLGLVVCLCAAWGLGTGMSSLMWWLLRQLPVGSAATLPWLDAGIWAAVVLALAMRVPRPPRTQGVARPGVTSRRLTPGVAGAMAVLLPIAALAATTFATRSFVVPHGEWDAWAIWNVRARASFLGLPAPGAERAPLPLLAHPDYPELLPGAIARAWTFAGVDDVSVPIALAALFAGSAVLLAAASIRHHGSATRGLLTAAFILASPALVNWTWSQGADVPLSFYILLTFVFAASATATGAASLWAFTGLTAGLAAWTKNEGILFMLVVTAIVAVWILRAASGTSRRTSLMAFAGGAAPPLLVLLMFKLSVAFPNEHVATLSLARAGAVLTWERLAMVGEAMGRDLWYGGATTIGTLPVLALFVAVNGAPGHRIPGARLTLVALVVMLAAYGLVYVLTPKDLAWHLRTSVDRVLLQLMPSIVWVGMLVTGRASDVARTQSPNPT